VVKITEAMAKTHRPRGKKKYGEKHWLGRGKGAAVIQGKEQPGKRTNKENDRLKYHLSAKGKASRKEDSDKNNAIHKKHLHFFRGKNQKELVGKGGGHL